MNFDFEAPEISYEDTLLKDMADDVKASQARTEQRVEELLEESKKSGRQALRVAVAALIVSSLTLLATVYFGLLH